MGLFSFKKMAKKFGKNVDELMATPEQKKAGAYIESLGVISMADGEMQDEEYDEVVAYIDGLDEISNHLDREKAIGIFTATCSSLEASSATLARIQRRKILGKIKEHASTPECRKMAMELAYGLAAAHGDVDSDEQSALQDLSGALGVPVPNY